MTKLQQVIDMLWEDYKKRCHSAVVYEALCKEAGVKLANDHIAFRTANADMWYLLYDLFGSLDYEPVQEYEFPDKKLSAVHFEHMTGDYPKIFISTFDPRYASDDDAEFTETVFNIDVDSHPVLKKCFTKIGKSYLTDFDGITSLTVEEIYEILSSTFMPCPEESILENLYNIDQYLGWVRCWGNAPNHFTGLVNEFKDFSMFEEELKDFDVGAHSTIDLVKHLLIKRGVEVGTVQGCPGSKLRQASTQAYDDKTVVIGRASIQSIDVPYAYYELAERGYVMFNGFMAEQASNLFDTTEPK